MKKRFIQPIMAVCVLGLLLSTANAQQKVQETMAVLKVGDKAPDFEIATLAGTKFKLSERYGKDGKDGKPTILLFSRANW